MCAVCSVIERGLSLLQQLYKGALGVDNAIHIFRLACMYNDTKIKEEALQFIVGSAENFLLISNKSEFVVLEKMLLVEIYTNLLIHIGHFPVPRSVDIKTLLATKNKSNKSPLHVACSNRGMSVCAQFLIQNGAEYVFYLFVIISSVLWHMEDI